MHAVAPELSGGWEKRKADSARPTLSSILGASAWQARNLGSCGNRAVTAAVGARNPGQLRRLIGAAAWRLSVAEVNEIERFLVENSG
jgi:hypothetical protein